MRKLLFVAFALAANAADFRLDSTHGLELVNAKAEAVSYRGRRAVRLDPVPGQDSTGSLLAFLPASNFKNGTIQVDLAGSPRAGAPATSRGFIGIAFRVQQQGAKYECFYVRPSNARSDDQLRRNHSAQYISVPDFPWERLRKETPGVYESYVDLEAGAWTTLKVVVTGTKAQLYVNNAKEPCLIVNDLKLGESEGRIALWSDSTTDGYFSNLTLH
jgi:hypothetical protein